MTFFWVFISFVISQRVSELFLAKRNERILKSAGAIEYDKRGYKYIVLMHVLFFAALIIEKSVKHTILNSYWYMFLGLFVCAQFLRYWAISELGSFWNTKILVIPGEHLIHTGPYRYMRHPNYLAVMIEIASIPLMFSCYLTAAIFSVVNTFLVLRRINLENSALRTVH